jgi:hypothetical protein
MTKNRDFAFGKQNYILTGISFLIIITGFILMTGSSVTEHGFNDDIFSVRRIKIAPTVSLAGFVLMIFAIMKNPAVKQKTAEKK